MLFLLNSFRTGNTALTAKTFNRPKSAEIIENKDEQRIYNNDNNMAKKKNWKSELNKNQQKKSKEEEEVARVQKETDVGKEER